METNLILDDQLNPKGFVDNTQRTKVLLIIFYVLLGFEILNALMSIEWRFYTDNELYMEFLSDEEKLESYYDYFSLFFAFFSLIIYLLSIIWFIKWFRRLYSNLHQSQLKSLKYKESMAANSWFIPILALFTPFQIMREIWTELQGFLSKHLADYRKKSNTIIGVWWFLFIASKILTRLTLIRTIRAEDLESVKINLILYDIYTVIQIAAILVTIKLIRDTAEIENQFLATYK